MKELRGAGRWDEALEAQARFWVGLVHQVVRGDHASSLPYFDRSYELARQLGDTITMSEALTLAREVGAQPFLHRIEAALAALG